MLASADMALSSHGRSSIMMGPRASSPFLNSNFISPSDSRPGDLNESGELDQAF